ncbi:hypothetical protein HY572_01760 [Candidatus Micrarchaeota archaeon]|nr:hypothetical protein [Candidatus Micrarchaeota archaeon]
MKKASLKKCERCGKEEYYFEPCTYCKRIVCKYCIKSSLTATKTERRVICKDCWGKKSTQKRFQAPASQPA